MGTVMMKLVAAALVAVTAASTPAPQFRAERIAAHMRFLASDLLEGRGTGTRGYDIAAEYVAAQFELAGLAPGVNGGWYQQIPFQMTIPGMESSVTLLRAGEEALTLKPFEQFVTTGDPLHAEKVVEQEIVFVGYGVTAPDQRYNDYAGADAKGKIVAFFSGAPHSFPNALRAHHSNSLNKIENAAKHGVAGVIFLTSPAEALRTPWERVTRGSKNGSMHWLEPDGKPHAVQPELSSYVQFGLEATRMLLGANADAVFRSLSEGRPKANPLRTRARIRVVSTHRKATSPNVIGVLRGSDPVLRDEYLVYSAHLDHIGITDPVNGDRINNGAFDNASGIASILEIARAFGSLPKPPRRSIIFLATTGEEKGLKGADYFANNPTVPLQSIVGNLNVDMFLMMRRTRDLIAFGAETNDLGDLARGVARDMDIELSEDPSPEEVIFVRSDQYPFVKKGVPALFVNTGYKSVDPSFDMEGAIRQWRRTRYHAPSDDLQQPIDYTAALPITEFNYRLGLLVANRDQRPRWKPGDFFGETFAKGR
jgi:Zn-dependent M28 family amino/carboxypeptidase